MGGSERVGLQVRRLEPGDLIDAERLSAAEGWPHRYEDWQLMLEEGQGVVGLIAEKVVATAMSWHFGTALATVGMILVDRRLRGQGIARRLLGQLLEELAVDRIQLHATQMAVPLYRAFGFQAEREVVQLQGYLPKRERQEKASCSSRSLHQEDIPSVLELDREACGGNRCGLLFRLLREGGGQVLVEQGRLQGFLLQRPFGGGIQVGPLVAREEKTALCLADELLGKLRGNFLRFDVEQGGRLATWLQQQGLQEAGSVLRMARGAAIPQGRLGQAQVYALASQAFG